MKQELLKEYAKTSAVVRNTEETIEKLAIDPFALLAILGAGASLYGAGQSGYKAYKNFQKGETKQGLKDLGWAGLDTASAALGGGWALSMLGRSAKLARIAAVFSKAGKPVTASKLLARAKRIGQGARAHQALQQSRIYSRLSKSYMKAGKVEEGYKALVQAAKLREGTKALPFLDKAIAIAEKSGKSGFSAKSTAGLRYAADQIKKMPGVKQVGQGFSGLGKGYDYVSSAPDVALGRNLPSLSKKLAPFLTNPITKKIGDVSMHPLVIGAEIGTSVAAPHILGPKEKPPIKPELSELYRLYVENQKKRS